MLIVLARAGDDHWMWIEVAQILIPILALLIAWGIGRTVENRHFRRLEQAEAELADILLSDLKRLPPGYAAKECHIVCGNAVIAIDYFKVFVGGLRNLIGGRVRGYERVMDRARREATVRMLREARTAGANLVIAVRYSTSTIGGGEGGGGAGGAEVLAYGTAVVPA